MIHWTAYLQTAAAVASMVATVAYVYLTYQIMRWAIAQSRATIAHAELELRRDDEAALRGAEFALLAVDSVAYFTGYFRGYTADSHQRWSDLISSQSVRERFKRAVESLDDAVRQMASGDIREELRQLSGQLYALQYMAYRHSQVSDQSGLLIPMLDEMLSSVDTAQVKTRLLLSRAVESLRAALSTYSRYRAPD